MLAFSALVAGSFALGPLVANDITPAALNAVRFWIAAGILAVFLFGTGRFRSESLKGFWRYPTLAFPFVTYFVLMFEGLKTAPSVSAAAVFTLMPMMAAGFGWLLLRQVTTPRILLALAIGAIGAVWVIFRADIALLLAFDIGRGEMIYFVGCIFHAVYTPLLAKLNRRESAGESALLILFSGAIMLTIYGWSDLRTTDWGSLPGIVWITILYTAVFASAASFTLLQFAALRLPSAKVMAYTFLTPSWVIVWIVLLGQAVPTGWILPGIGLTFIALFLLLKEEEAAPDQVRGARSS